MKFVDLPEEEKADWLLGAAVDAAIQYYEKSGGDHIQDARREPLLQTKMWDAICSGPEPTVCTFETGPADVLTWARIENADKIADWQIDNLNVRSRFDECSVWENTTMKPWLSW